MIPYLKKLIILLLCLLLTQSTWANDEFLELQRLYKEMFGIDLVDEEVTEQFDIIVNGEKQNPQEITYKNMSFSFSISKELFFQMIETSIEPEAKAILNDLLPSTLNKDILIKNTATKKVRKPIKIKIYLSNLYLINLKSLVNMNYVFKHT